MLYECADVPQPLIIIPARLRAVRLPDKALALIAGRPMIAHVVARAIAAGVGPVVVATDTDAIAAAAEAAGARVVMTRESHVSGSDRVAEALSIVDPRERHDVVVNLQGDEPEIDPVALRAALMPLDDPAVDIATLAAPLQPAEIADSSAVKATGRLVGPARLHATAFSRAMPPPPTPAWRHVGVYAWRRAALLRFIALPPSEREKTERLEQWRGLDAGMRIDAALVEHAPRGVDTPADLAAVRVRFARGDMA